MSRSQGKGDAPRDEKFRHIEEDLRYVADDEVHQTLNEQSLGDQTNDGVSGLSLSDDDARPISGIVNGCLLAIAMVLALLVVVLVTRALFR
jgi:hypothetical protein